MGLFSYACVRLLLFPAIPFSHSQLSSNVCLLGSVYVCVNVCVCARGGVS